MNLLESFSWCIWDMYQSADESYIPPRDFRRSLGCSKLHELFRTKSYLSHIVEHPNRCRDTSVRSND